MEVRNIRWVGVPAHDYEAMVAFLQEVLGLRVSFRNRTTVEFSTSEGDQIQVMAPGDGYYDFFIANSAGPVPLFEVDDVHRARRELEEAGAEVIGPTAREQQLGVDPFPCPGSQSLRTGQPTAEHRIGGAPGVLSVRSVRRSRCVGGHTPSAIAVAGSSWQQNRTLDQLTFPPQCAFAQGWHPRGDPDNARAASGSAGDHHRAEVDGDPRTPCDRGGPA
jgi:predicted enzyme related to lactoylglutathione lyase